MSNQDTAKPRNENGGPPPDSDSAAKSSRFGQSLPRTAPVPTPGDSASSPTARALFNTPDWRPGEEILREAAARDPSIRLPEDLNPKTPPVLETRVRHRSPAPLETASPPTAPSSPTASTAKSPHTADFPGQGTSTRTKPGSTPHSPNPTNPTNPTNSLPGWATQTTLRFVANLAVLCMVSFSILLLSTILVPFPEGVVFFLEDFYMYFVLSALVTSVIVLVDQLGQILARRLQLPTALAWVGEITTAGLAAGAILGFFTTNPSFLGGAMLGITIAALTAVVSISVSKLF